MTFKKFNVQESYEESYKENERFESVFNEFGVRSFTPHLKIARDHYGFRLDGKVNSQQLLKALEVEFPGYKFSYIDYHAPDNLTGLTWTEVRIKPVKDITQLLSKLHKAATIKSLNLSDNELVDLERLLDKII